MNINVQPGTYVVAVSGGVDSVALLDMLLRQPDITLIVAHFDHGIRHDSHMDRQLVQAIAKKHGLQFVYHEGNLGADASEETARAARYAFLHQVRSAANARAVLTGHHHDDAIETAIINILRGTGRKGLSSLSSRGTVQRPLLHLHKHELQTYARHNNLVWREDSSNNDTRYLRNHVRHVLLPRFSAADKQQLRTIIERTAELNHEIETHLVHYLHVQPALDKISRSEFVLLPHAVAKEVMAAWLRKHGIRDFDQKTLERLVVGAKTHLPGKSMDIVKNRRVQVANSYLALA